MRATSTQRERSWPITIASAILSVLFTVLGLAAWFITYEEPIPFEFFVRLITSIVFITIAFIMLKVAMRGYNKTPLRDLLRDLLAGGL